MVYIYMTYMVCIVYILYGGVRYIIYTDIYIYSLLVCRYIRYVRCTCIDKITFDIHITGICDNLIS